MEERRLEELRKNEDQKEAARREMERQRQQEMEDNKRQELLTRRQKEQDEVLRLKGVNHGLGLELSQLVRIFNINYDCPRINNDFTSIFDRRTKSKNYRRRSLKPASEFPP